MSHYKFLEKGAKGPVTGFQWQLGVWVETDGSLSPCERGVHVLRARDLAHWLHQELWTVDIEGEVIDGGDCVVARRARLAAKVDAWTGEGGARFSKACQERLEVAIKETTDDAVRRILEQYHWAVGWHIDTKNPAMAGYVSALGLATNAPVGEPSELFRRERAWQSDWIVRELAL